MKKKFLAVLLAAAMVVGLTACGGSDKGESNGGSSNNGGSVEELDDYGSGEITIWVAEEVNEFTKQQAESFLAAHPEYSGYTVTVESVGEGEAAGNVITDVLGGPDIYGFAQDQLTRLVSAGALMELPADYANFVAANNDAGAAGAAKMGDATYAFPMTSDNGYFLYYDSSVITNPGSLDQILADCEAAGTGFYMEINSGWYMPAFFFPLGCELTYETDLDGRFVSSNITYATDSGLAALKAIIEMVKSPAFYNGSDVSSATNASAIISGTWNSGAAQALFGDNYACAKLPAFTANGTSCQMGGFGGFKLIGVKPQTEVGKAIVCLELAQYLSSGEVQLARYQQVGWGPSNLEAQQNEAVQADEALSALAEQLAFTIPQGQYPDDYWSLTTSLGDTIIAGDYDNYTDDQLMTVLEEYQQTCQSYVSN